MKLQFKTMLVTVLALLFAVSASAGMEKTRKGAVYVYDSGSSFGKIHTYRAPFKAAANTSTIIELSDRLIIVDFQLAEPFAREFRAYADSLGKKIDRAYLSHEHPDHWMGSIAFQDVKTYALPEVMAFVKAHGDKIIKKKGKPGKIPNFAGVVKPGTETIGGVSFKFSQYKEGESHNTLVIALPELKTVLLQDLLFSNTHFYLGNNTFDGWINSLREMVTEYKDYSWFIPGHGNPRTSKVVFAENIAYLEEVKKAFAGADGDAKKIEQQLLKTFTDYKCGFFLSFGLPHALNQAQKR